MQIAEKWQLPPFRLGMCTAEEPLVEFRSLRLAGLIGPIQRELFLPKEMVSRALGLGNRKSCKNSTGEFARTRSGEGGHVMLHLLELDIRTPGRGLTRSRGGAQCVAGKNGGFPFTILKPRAEGYEMEIVANLAF